MRINVIDIIRTKEEDGGDMYEQTFATCASCSSKFHNTFRCRLKMTDETETTVGCSACSSIRDCNKIPTILSSLVNDPGWTSGDEDMRASLQTTIKDSCAHIALSGVVPRVLCALTVRILRSSNCVIVRGEAVLCRGRQTRSSSIWQVGGFPWDNVSSSNANEIKGQWQNAVYVFTFFSSLIMKSHRFPISKTRTYQSLHHGFLCFSFF